MSENTENLLMQGIKEIRSNVNAPQDLTDSYVELIETEMTAENSKELIKRTFFLHDVMLKSKKMFDNSFLSSYSQRRENVGILRINPFEEIKNMEERLRFVEAVELSQNYAYRLILERLLKMPIGEIREVEVIKEIPVEKQTIKFQLPPIKDEKVLMVKRFIMEGKNTVEISKIAGIDRNAVSGIRLTLLATGHIPALKTYGGNKSIDEGNDNINKPFDLQKTAEPPLTAQ